jgi:hypothetical protein
MGVDMPMIGGSLLLLVAAVDLPDLSSAALIGPPASRG